MTNNPVEVTKLKSIEEAYDLWVECGMYLDQLESPREIGWKKFYGESPQNFLAVYDDQDLIATCALLDDGRKLTIQRLAVKSAYRRQGIGRALLESAEQEASGRGLSGICALIEDKNDVSRALALVSGFEEKPDARYFTKSIFPKA